MNSSAECERLDCPGPIFNVGNGHTAWLLVVGDPKGSSPRDSPLTTAGWDNGRFELPSLVERAFTSHETLPSP